MKHPLIRSLLAILVATVASVGWGMVFWGVLADPLGMFHAIPNAAAVTELLEHNETPTGTYFFPWPRNTQESFEAFTRQHEQGPFYKLSYIREGVDPNSPRKLTIGCLQYASVAAMAVAMLWIIRSPSFPRRASAVFLGGMMGTNLISLGDPVWFHLPWDYALGSLLYETVAWLLVATVTACFIHRPRAT